MTNAKIVVPLLLLAALAGGAAYLLLDQPTVTPEVPTATAPEQPTQPKATGPAPITAPPAIQEPQRTEVDASQGAAQADAAQGVRGRVLLPDGTAAAAVTVMLIENVAMDAASIFLRNKSTKTVTPLALSQTAADGTFALGLRQPGKPCDLRIVSDEHPERNMAQLRVREGDWYDTGDIRLDFGSLVQGRVVEEDTQLGVANATVFLASSQQAHMSLATPGRERGIAALTDTSGFFRFTSAPTQGLVNLSVEAVGYASSPVQNQPLKPGVPNEFTLQVVRGEPIAGVVVDPNGKPIAGASVTATGLSTKTPQNATATTDQAGTFSFPSLRVGPYQVASTMDGFLEAREPMVMSGDTEVKLVLGERSFMKLRVLAASGSPVKAYRISLTRYFPNNPGGVGKVLDFPDRNVNPGDYPAEFRGEWAVVRGLPPGEFRLQVEDKAHAKTLSTPFSIVEGGPTPEVTVELTLGGTIVGTVIDDSGQPVADAIVTTDMNSGVAADIGFLEMFRSMMPEKHSKRQERTDSQGRFRLTKLAFSDYMLRVAHPSFCEGTAINIKLENAGQVADAGVVQLMRGAIVEGLTTIGGVPAGQIQVTVSTPFTDQLAQRDPNQKPAMVLFNAKVISTGDGHYRLLKRVPPGSYKITAGRQGAENPFVGMIDMKESEQQLVVSPGQDRIEINLNLSKR